MRKHAKVWFVLADGARARILIHRVGEQQRFEEITQAPAIAGPEQDIADLLNLAASRGLFDGLVLVAPQRTLNGLRQALHGPAGERLIHGEARDLLALPEQPLAARLTAMLRRHAAPPRRGG